GPIGGSIPPVPVIIQGRRLIDTLSVQFGGIDTEFQVVNDSQITAFPPQGGNGGTVDIVVTNTNGSSDPSSADWFTYVYPVPSVQSLSIQQGSSAGGDSVTITGSGFTGVTSVNFGNTPAQSFTFVNDTEITAISPPGDPTGSPVDVTVTTPGCTSPLNSPADWFTYVYPIPSVQSLSPQQGSAAGGDTVTITGSNFTGATSVNFGGTQAQSFNVDSDTQITAITPAGDPSGPPVDVTVANPDYTSQVVPPVDQFTYQ
ncbi:MAG TPA: IPT/TIG domain-containing protein, partial [Candidatus Bathyarchaeia archaeon]|nr:IPT/TIG domain-containing protein [Candidatus Bathyarchaeia archaeon]